MFTEDKKCMCKGLFLGLAIGMTAGFITHMITSQCKPKTDLKSKIAKAIKAAGTFMEG